MRCWSSPEQTECALASKEALTYEACERLTLGRQRIRGDRQSKKKKINSPPCHQPKKKGHIHHSAEQIFRYKLLYFKVPDEMLELVRGLETETPFEAVFLGLIFNRTCQPRGKLL
jgi:hypothetical protein